MGRFPQLTPVRLGPQVPDLMTVSLLEGYWKHWDYRWDVSGAAGGAGMHLGSWSQHIPAHPETCHLADVGVTRSTSSHPSDSSQILVYI